MIFCVITLLSVTALRRLMRCLFAVHLGFDSVRVWLWPQALFALFKDSACSGQIWLLLKYRDSFTLFYLMAVAKNQNIPLVSLKYALITICQKRKIIILKLCYMCDHNPPFSRFKSFIYVCGSEFLILCVVCNASIQHCVNVLALEIFHNFHPLHKMYFGV